MSYEEDIDNIVELFLKVLLKLKRLKQRQYFRHYYKNRRSKARKRQHEVHFKVSNDQRVLKFK